MVKSIKRAEFEDFDIEDAGKMVGSVRIKPSGILWRPKGKHSWFGVNIEQFAEANGISRTNNAPRPQG